MLTTDVSAPEAARLDVGSLMRALRTRPEGLTSEEADGLLRLVGPNRLPRAPGPGVVAKLFAQLTHFFALMLWVASALALIGGLPQLAIAIVLVILVNGLFSFAQEERATRAAEALSALMPVVVEVIRDGRRIRVPADVLVPGDIVHLREGVRVSADARLIESDGLLIDASTMTGESVPVEWTARSLDDTPATLMEARNLVLAGTHVVAGSGTAVVVRTGPSTVLGGIAHMTASVVRRPTPFRRTCIER